jgi:hypothetical protein
VSSVYTFLGIPIQDHKFFIGGDPTPPPEEEDFVFFNTNEEIFLNLTTGHAVWLLPGGGHFGGHVNITGTLGLSSLVIVATASGNEKIHQAFPQLPRFTGLWFQGGITSNIPVILISDGTVAIDHYRNDKNSNVAYMSIFAGGVLLKGPAPGFELRIMHWPSALGLTELEILGPLLELLPNSPVGGTRATFTLEPGTWREVTESNPS